MDNRYQIIEYHREPKQTLEFLELPLRLYSGNEGWIPPSQDEVKSFLDGSHPFHSFLRHQSFLIVSSGRTIGRATAFINQALTVDGEPVGSIGFFECEEDDKAAVLLIDKACEWLKAQGIGLVWAPMNGTIWSSYRFMIKGFGDIPFVKEPYNQPYYPAFFERAGFEVFKRWSTRTFSGAATDELMNRLGKIYPHLLRKGYRFRQLMMDEFDQELSILYELVFDAYSDLNGYHKITPAIFQEVFRNLKEILLPEFAYFALDPQGNPVGFHLMVPTYSPNVRSTMENTASHHLKIQSMVTLHLGITHEEVKKNNGLGGALLYVGFSAAQKRQVPIRGALAVENSPSTVFLNYATEDPHEYCLYDKKLTG